MRLTFVLIEGEGTAVMDQAVRAITEAFVWPRQTVPAVPVEEVRALPALEPSVRKPRKAKREPAAKSEDAGTRGGGTIADLVLKSLESGQKTAEEVTTYVQKHGMPDYTRKKASATLSYLGKKGAAKVDPETWVWRLA